MSVLGEKGTNDFVLKASSSRCRSRGAEKRQINRILVGFVTGEGAVPGQRLLRESWLWQGLRRRQLIHRERSGLVARTDVHIRRILSRAEAADQHTLPRQFPGAHGHADGEHHWQCHGNRARQHRERKRQVVDDGQPFNEGDGQGQRDLHTDDAQQPRDDAADDLIDVQLRTGTATSCVVRPKYVLTPVATTTVVPSP